jgi:putative component of membrane protein insertase Oxa1/YidC/SpoIIIJ protein YidD
MVWLYKRCLSERLKRRCRYYPTCSTYALLALHNLSLFAASCSICGRLYRCSSVCSKVYPRLDYPLPDDTKIIGSDYHRRLIERTSKSTNGVCAD